MKAGNLEMAVAAAIVVCYLVARRFYFDHINFAAWAFLLFVVAAVIVPRSAAAKREFKGRERTLVRIIVPVTFAFAYDLMHLPPNPIDARGVIVAAYAKSMFSVLNSGVGWLAVRNIRPAEDAPAVKYVFCVCWAALGIGSFFTAWHTERDSIFFMIGGFMALMVSVAFLQRRAWFDFVKSQKGEGK